MRQMTCREFDEVVHGFVRMELLDLVVREEALEHAANCTNCADRLLEAGVLAEAAEGMAKSMGEQQAPARVEAALLTAFRSHVRRTAWRRTFEWATVGAAAAMLLVFLWTFAARPKQQLSPLPKKDASSQPGALLNAAEPDVSQPGEVADTADVEIADASGESYSASDFVPVPFTDGFGPEEPSMVVRVQLTQASLTELGYPVVDIPDDDLISADVLVGEDGWPRAVRVVQ